MAFYLGLNDDENVGPLKRSLSASDETKTEDISYSEMPPKGKGKGKPAGGPGGNGGEEAKAGEKISEVGDDVFLGLKFIVIRFRLIRSGSRSRSSLWKKSSTEGTTSSEGLREELEQQSFKYR